MTQSESQPPRADQAISDNSLSPEGLRADGQTLTESSNPDETPLAPMTPTLMGRLFLVPAVLVSVMIATCAVIVLTFGWPASAPDETLVELAARVAGSTGEKTGGALMPRNKDVWMAARELASRIEKERDQLKPIEMQTVAISLSNVYEQIAAISKPEETDIYRGHFVLLTIGHLDTPESFDTLSKSLKSPVSDFRRAGLIGLVTLSSHSETATQAVPDVATLLNDPDDAVRITASNVLGHIGRGGYKQLAIGALTLQLTRDAEMQWNSALSLARLGSNAANSILLQMLQREYWSGIPVQLTAAQAAAANTADRPMSPAEIERYLCATIEYAAPLNDPQLNAQIEKLKSDESIPVRKRALAALNGKSEDH